jgi:outer membrane protein OmpA-like peptidoglycan-associated protein
MKSKVIVLLAGSLLATSGWTAERNRAPKEEAIGLGSGAAIGAMAGGPVGFIVGAAFGGWLGDRFHHERSERLAAAERYERTKEEKSSLEGRLADSERRAARVESELTTERIAHREELKKALAVEVLFRTEESGLDPQIEQRLAEIVELIGSMDGTLIRLEGYADARGTEDYNEQLSAARAVAVRDALIRAGMPASRIVLSAAGESTATAPEQDVDGMALERRVQMSIIDVDDASRVAQQSLE